MTLDEVLKLLRSVRGAVARWVESGSSREMEVRERWERISGGELEDGSGGTAMAVATPSVPVSKGAAFAG